DLLSARGRTALSPVCPHGTSRRRGPTLRARVASDGRGTAATSSRVPYAHVPTVARVSHEHAVSGPGRPGTLRGERVPVCDFLLAADRETAGRGAGGRRRGGRATGGCRGGRGRPGAAHAAGGCGPAGERCAAGRMGGVLGGQGGCSRFMAAVMGVAAGPVRVVVAKPGLDGHD